MRFGRLGRRRRGPDLSTLGEVLDFLHHNPDKMYVTRDKRGALIYYPPARAVMYISGDFDGTVIWCNFELHRRMVQLELME